MSATNTNAAVAMGLQGVEALVAMTLAGKLATLNSTVQSSLASGTTTAEAEVDKLQATLDAFTTETPLVATILDAVPSLLHELGLEVPSEEQISTHLKAAIADVVGALQTPSTLTAA